jgi:hypothetical protein
MRFLTFLRHQELESVAENGELLWARYNILKFMKSSSIFVNETQDDDKYET